MILCIGTLSWVRIARYVRAETLALKEDDFIHSLQALGQSELKIIGMHILPQAAEGVGWIPVSLWR